MTKAESQTEITVDECDGCWRVSSVLSFLPTTVHKVPVWCGEVLRSRVSWLLAKPQYDWGEWHLVCGSQGIKQFAFLAKQQCLYRVTVQWLKSRTFFSMKTGHGEPADLHKIQKYVFRRSLLLWSFLFKVFLMLLSAKKQNGCRYKWPFFRYVTFFTIIKVPYTFGKVHTTNTSNMIYLYSTF